MSNKAPNEDRPRHSVIYSFFSKWEMPLRSEKVHVFFRKRIPSKQPYRVYFYVGAPVMAVIGSAEVLRVEVIRADDALTLATDGCIADSELAKYLGNRPTVGAVHVHNFDFFERPIGAEEIAAAMVFSPPQNFQNLNVSDEAILRRLAL